MFIFSAKKLSNMTNIRFSAVVFSYTRFVIAGRSGRWVNPTRSCKKYLNCHFTRQGFYLRRLHQNGFSGNMRRVSGLPLARNRTQARVNALPSGELRFPKYVEVPTLKNFRNVVRIATQPFATKEGPFVTN